MWWSPNDYHIEYDGHLYSVPHDADHKTVDIRATSTVIEVLHENRRIAVHAMSRSHEDLPPCHDHGCGAYDAGASRTT